jgi:4-aminobutyrate aminotransferase-like enzyme
VPSLQIVQEEKLQQNALEVGNFLKTGLKELAKKYPIIASVRGQGLFLGIELTDEERNPLSEQTAYLANRMKENGILMSTDGPDHNVLKIKPPLIFSYSNAQLFLQNMDTIFAEDEMHIIKN